MLRATVVLATVLAAAPACADWQYTRWGMTVDQALAASGGTMAPCTPTACKSGAGSKFQPKTFGRYQSGEFKFESILLFDNAGGLAMVALKLLELEHLNRLQDALISKYGEPVIENAGFLHIRRWMTATDRIELRNIGADKPSLVLLNYTPRSTISNKGL